MTFGDLERYFSKINCGAYDRENYDKYLEVTLSHLALMSDINFEYALEEMKKTKLAAGEDIK